MNPTPRCFFLILFLALAGGISHLPAQDAAPTASTDAATSATSDLDTAPPAGSTVITSDELQMDENKDGSGRTAVFSGSVVADGTNFKMTCDEMTVTFTKDSKIDTITATGNVVIIQPGRVTRSGEAEYFHADDKFVLTDEPSIIDNGNKIEAVKIIIYRTKGSLYTEGRTTTTITSGHGIDSGAETKPATDDSSTK